MSKNLDETVRILVREKGESERERGEERVAFTVTKCKYHGGEGGQAKKNLPRRSRRKHKRVSGRKSSPGGSGES